MAKLFSLTITRDKDLYWTLGGQDFCHDEALRRQFDELPADLTRAVLMAYTEPGPDRFVCKVKADSVGLFVGVYKIWVCKRESCTQIAFFLRAIVRILKRHGLKPGNKFYVQIEY